MRIIHLIDYFQPQLGYQETFLAREHARMGHNVHVVTSDRFSPFIFEANRSVLGKRERSRGFFDEEGIKVWRLKTLFEFPHAIWIRGLENKVLELEPDIVIVHGIVTFSAIRVARLKSGANKFKLIYDDHMTFDNSTSRLRVLYPLFRYTFSSLIQDSADALVGIADACQDFMNRSYGIPIDRISVVPLGADDELFRFDEASRLYIRGQLNIEKNDIVFIYTGKIIPEKKLSLLLDALKLIKDQGNIKILLVGDGPLAHIEELKQRAIEGNVEGKFIWQQVVHNKELYKFYSAADVAIWPRGATISQREAMACNLPIIISDGSMVTELVAYNNGLICKENNPLDLSEKMQRLLDPALRKEMGRNSRSYIEEKLSLRVTAKRFIELAT
jgi:glycosyltransferase involved in cell wall biosynthesis